MYLTSMHDLEICKNIELMPGVTFYGIFLALIRRADTDKLIRLQNAFPEVVKEARIRYHAPGGALNIEELRDHYPASETEKIPQEMLEYQFRIAEKNAAKRI